MLQCLLHMPQFEFALRTAESIAKVGNLGQKWAYIANIVILEPVLKQKPACPQRWMEAKSAIACCETLGQFVKTRVRTADECTLQQFMAHISWLSQGKGGSADELLEAWSSEFLYGT